MTTDARAPLARLQLLAAAALFSTGGAAIKGTTLTSWQVAAFRSLIAGVALLVFIPASRRRWSRPTLAVGLVYAATMVLFVMANKLTTAANAIFLQATAPLYVMVLAPLTLGERIRRQDTWFVAAMAAGLAAFVAGVDSPSATSPDPVRGNIAGAASGVAWALTVMGLRWLGSREDGGTLQAVVAGNACAALLCLPFALPIASATAADWIVLFWLGVFQIGLAYVCLVAGVRRVTAFEASLLLLAEPVLNPIWAWLVHGERPGSWAMAGGAVILIATAIRTVLERRR